MRINHHLDILLPDSSGIFFPWIPPVWLPDEMLSDLEDVFIYKLRRILETISPSSAEIQDRLFERAYDDFLLSRHVSEVKTSLMMKYLR